MLSDGLSNLTAIKHAPVKQKHIRMINQSAFMTKEIRKAIMTLQNYWADSLRKKTKENKDGYKKPRNHCVDFIRKTKEDLYNNPDVKSITDNKLFWKTVKPFFSNKVIKDQRIILIDNDETILRIVK